MMAGFGDGDATSAAGADSGPARHIPVLLEEVAQAMGAKPGETIIDGTFGAGGYSRRIMDVGANVIGIDRDPDAIRDGQLQDRLVRCVRVLRVSARRLRCVRLWVASSNIRASTTLETVALRNSISAART